MKTEVLRANQELEEQKIENGKVRNELRIVSKENVGLNKKIERYRSMINQI